MAKMQTPIPALKLSHGPSIPMLGYGTGTIWNNLGGSNIAESQQIVDIVKIAIESGYHHIDCAESYYKEPEVGIAIKESGVDRSKLFVTTKVKENIDDIPAALDASLKKLQLDYVDLYLIHSPWAPGALGESRDSTIYQSQWKSMETVLASGKARSIGVSNFRLPHLQAILSTAVTSPSVNQIEFHPFLQRPSLLEFHKQHGIATMAYSALTPLTRKNVDASAENTKTSQELSAYLAALEKKYAVSSSEILIRYCIDQDIGVITTSCNEQRMSDYLRATKIKLTPREILEISRIGEGLQLQPVR